MTKKSEDEVKCPDCGSPMDPVSNKDKPDEWGDSPQRMKCRQCRRWLWVTTFPPESLKHHQSGGLSDD